MKTHVYWLMMAAALVWTACGGEKKEDENISEVKDEAVHDTLNNEKEELNEIAEFKFHIFIANIPSPLETMVKLPVSGIVFNKDLVQPTSQATRYKTLARKAIAYGAFGTDLGYATVFEQGDMIADYFSTTKTFAEELGAGENFNRTVASRFSNNMANRDSLLILMDKAIGESEDYLKNNQRLELASLMMAGSWLESQFILLNSLSEKDTSTASALFQKLPEQKNHLKSILDVLKEQKGNKDTENTAATLFPLVKLYNEINSTAASVANLQKLKKEVGAAREKLMK